MQFVYTLNITMSSLYAVCIQTGHANVQFVYSLYIMDSQIDKHISFNRKFEKWDMINQSILLAALSELQNTENAKIKIIFNDYLNIGKLFIDQTNITTINAILDKIIYDNKR